jgi:hypothetical protein
MKLFEEISEPGIFPGITTHHYKAIDNKGCK